MRCETIILTKAEARKVRESNIDNIIREKGKWAPIDGWSGWQIQHYGKTAHLKIYWTED